MLATCEINSQQYLNSKLQAELKLLSAANDASYRDRGVYCIDRNTAADLASEPIRHLLKDRPQPKIIEIGCGEGNAIKKILSDHQTLLPENITATTLNFLPEHQDLIDLGVNLETEVIAENLPDNWKNSFDLAIASVVLQWTNTDLSVPQIIGTLTSKGIFLGFDSRPVVAQTESIAMELGMVSILSPQQKQRWESNGHSLVPFILQKTS